MAISTAMEKLVREMESGLHADVMTVIRQVENDFEIAFKRLTTDEDWDGDSDDHGDGDDHGDSDDDGDGDDDGDDDGEQGGGGLDLAEVARFAERVEDCRQRVSNLAKMAVTST